MQEKTLHCLHTDVLAIGAGGIDDLAITDVLVLHHVFHRERCLLASVEGEAADGDAMSETARRLRLLSGLYDQAARAASSL